MFLEYEMVSIAIASICLLQIGARIHLSCLN